MAGNGKFGGREVVIVEAVRTPVGRGHEEKGYYKDTHPSNLLARSYTELIDRSGIDASEVEDVVAGCVQQFGEQAFNIGRNAWLEAGLPIETPATTLDRQCGSGQQAVNFAAALIASGVHDVVIGGGRRAHGPHLVRRRDRGAAGARDGLFARADGALQPRPAGDLGGDDRRPVGDPAVRARRDRPALAPARGQGHRGGPFRPRDDPDAGQRRHLHGRPGHSPGHDPGGARRAQARVQGGRQDHRRQLLADLRRRRRGAADEQREGRRARSRRHGRGSSTRPRSASTR